MREVGGKREDGGGEGGGEEVRGQRRHSRWAE